MRCENLYCIYESNGECVLDEVGITANGCCDECILVSMPFEALEKLKQLQREEFKQSDEYNNY